MYLVRPATSADIPALEVLAAHAPAGVHTLPRTRKAITIAVESSLASFASEPELPREETYLFVLEAGDRQTLAGTAAISATAGGSGIFFAFRNDVLNQVSRDLNISHRVHALTLSSDLTNCAQLSGFYLQEGCGGLEAELLSRARVMFAALAPRRFGDRFFAAMSGTTDEHGGSPFWDALGRKFFGMDFLQAERMIEGARNRTLIMEMMPHYPVYVPLLSPAAQAAMGQIHAEAKLPFRILSEEGFEPGAYIDIFDGGPILQAPKNALRSFAQSMLRKAAIAAEPGDVTPHTAFLVAVAREEGFRVLVAECQAPPLSDSILLPENAMKRLGAEYGEPLLCVRLRG